MAAVGQNVEEGSLRRFLFNGRAAFLGVVALSLCIRIFFLWNHEGLWGVDGGAYLLSSHYVQTGEQIADFKRPLLAPGWLLVPFVNAFGYDWGLRWFSLAAYLPILPATYYISRKALSPMQSVLAVFGVAMSWQMTEMWTAGVLPMIAFACMVFGMGLMWEIAKQPRWGHKLIMGGLIGLMAHTNQTVAGIALITIPAYVLALGLFERRLKHLIWHLVPSGLIALVIIIPTIPYYLQVTPGSGLLRYPGPLLGVYTWANACWFMAAFLWPVGWVSVIKGKGIIRPVGLLLLILVPISCLHSYDEALMNILYRARYLQMVPFYICLVYWSPTFLHWLERKYDWKPIYQPAIGVALVVVLLGHLFQCHAETKLGRMVSEDTHAGILWLNENAPGASTGTNSYSMSLFVAALTGTYSPWLQVYDPPAAYRDQHKDMSCVVGWTLDCDPKAAIDRLQVDYILANKLWPAVEAEIGDQVEGLGWLYRTIEAASPWHDEILGRTWSAEEGLDPLPWRNTTKHATWLEPVWDQGHIQIWEVAK